MAKHTFEELARMKPRQLEDILRGATPPDPNGLVGWEFRGWNVVEPIGEPVVRLLGIRRFAKGFYVAPGDKPPSEGGQLLGYNVDIRPGGLDEPWTGKPSDEAPKRRGFFVVHLTGAKAHPNSLFLDYSGRADKNGVFDGGPLFGDGGLKDFLVQPDADNPDVLLGKAYYRLPPLTVPGGFFVLQRWRQYAFQEAA